MKALASGKAHFLQQTAAVFTAAVLGICSFMKIVRGNGTPWDP